MFKKKINTENLQPTESILSNELDGAAMMRKVRELEIKSKKITTHLFTGEYHSAFKGQGMSFREGVKFREKAIFNRGIGDIVGGVFENI